MLKRAIPHISLVIALMMLALFIIDRVNEAMNFIGNDVFDWLLLLFCLSAIATAVRLIAQDRRRP